MHLPACQLWATKLAGERQANSSSAFPKQKQRECDPLYSRCINGIMPALAPFRDSIAGKNGFTIPDLCILLTEGSILREALV
jgi:hypothetical protein